VYFGVMLLLGALAVAIRKVGEFADVPVLQTVSLVVIIGAAALVSGAVVVSSVRALRSETGYTTTTAD
jgi:hypothetical protein